MKHNVDWTITIPIPNTIVRYCIKINSTDLNSNETARRFPNNETFKLGGTIDSRNDRNAGQTFVEQVKYYFIDVRSANIP